MRNNLIYVSALAAALYAAPVAAAPITFDGYTTGCFFKTVACTPSTVEAAQTITFDDLSYLNTSFSGTSVGGALALSLGQFSLLPAGGNDNYAGNNFNLRISFEAPTGLGTSTTVFTSVLTGLTKSGSQPCSPNPAPCGSVSIDFDNTPIPFSFTNGSTTGSFLLTVNDLTILANQTNVSLTGMITAANQETGTGPTLVPEPASLFLFGTGGLALAARLRRRK